MPPQTLPSPPAFSPLRSSPAPDNFLNSEARFFGTESLNDVRNDLWNSGKFETDYSKPIMSLTDKAENLVEIIPKVKERKPKPEEITFSDELSKLFPEANEKIAEQEEKINNLPLKNIGEIFSKIDQGEVPKELEFFLGGLSNEFENRVRSLGVSTNSGEFLDFLQSKSCAEFMKANKLKIHVGSGNIYNDRDTNESIYSFFEAQEDETKKWIDFEFILLKFYKVKIGNTL